MSVPVSQVLYRPGSPIDELYFVREGRLEVLLPIDAGAGVEKEKRIAILVGGTFLNVKGFWLHEAVRTTVLATERSQLWVLTKEKMAQMEREAPALALQVSQSVLRFTLHTDLWLRQRLASHSGGNLLRYGNVGLFGGAGEGPVSIAVGTAGPKRWGSARAGRALRPATPEPTVERVRVAIM